MKKGSEIHVSRGRVLVKVTVIEDRKTCSILVSFVWCLYGLVRTVKHVTQSVWDVTFVTRLEL